MCMNYEVYAADTKTEIITVKINGIECQVPKGMPMLLAAEQANIKIPRLCYHNDFYRAGLNGSGSCGLCVVKNNATGRIMRSCMMKAMPNMDISTEDPECIMARQTAMQLILANHPLECLTCIRNQRCELQKLAAEMNIREIPFTQAPLKLHHDTSSVSIHIDPNKCIKCARCVITCREFQQVEALELSGLGHGAYIRAIDGMNLADTPCIMCGQCTAHCPVAGIYEHEDREIVKEILNDKRYHTVSQIAPAVRVSLGEEFGLEPGTITTGKIYAALRRLGFDKIFDTNVGADITIMEEAAEFTDRFLNHKDQLPCITSCCPSWVNFCEKYYPDLISKLSTTKSPAHCLGAMIKTYYAEQEHIDPALIKHISIMPCTSKKFEITHNEDTRSTGYPEIDYSITTRELAGMIKEAGIDFVNLPEEEADQLLGEYSGAGTIFGATGGVLEAALRTAYFNITGEDLADDAVDFKEARGLNKNKIATIDIKGTPVKVAIAHGTSNVKAILTEVQEAIAKGEPSPYDIIEIMACYGGCIGGGGQPYSADPEVARMKRMKGLYTDDIHSKKRRSHHNPMIQKLYSDYVGKPLGKISHHQLHTKFNQRPVIRKHADLPK